MLGLRLSDSDPVSHSTDACRGAAPALKMSRKKISPARSFRRHFAELRRPFGSPSRISVKETRKEMIDCEQNY